MLKSYLTIGLRNLLRNKGYALINILGLAIGIAACLLIFTIVRFELSYDTFQRNYSRIYRVVTNEKYTSGELGYNTGVSTPVPAALRLDLPQAEKIAVLQSAYGSQVTVLGKDPNPVLSEKKFIEDVGIVYTEPAWFDIFDSQWLMGNPQTALTEPNTVVLSQTQASKYFGNCSEAIGQYLKLNNEQTLKVTGIIADAPLNSDFPLKVIVSYETFKNAPNYSTDWGNLSSNHQVFILLPENLSASSLQPALKKFNEKYYKAVSNSKRYNVLHPLSENHFDSVYGNLGENGTSSRSTLWTLSLIGVLILVMACINFVNLATAQAVKRSKEVGIRKVLGSSRRQLVGQFMGETTLIVLVAVTLALVIAQLSLPAIREVSNVPEDVAFLKNPYLWLFVAAVAITVSFLSGTYPALVLSGFEPAQALKSKITARTIGGIPLRRGLVVVQFAISQILIVGTLIAVAQMDFIRNIELGFNKDAVYVVGISSDSVSRTQFEGFKRRLLQHPAIKAVSLANDAPSSYNWSGRNFYFDNSPKELDFNAFMKYADADYFKAYGMTFVAGRGYQPGDTARAYVVNETLLKKLGVKNPQEAIGKTIRLGGRGAWKPIVGVVKDFKTSSVRDAVQALIIAQDQENYATAGIKIHPQNLQKTVDEIKTIWEKTFPAYVYDSNFLDESIARFYRQENQLALAYKIFAGLAVFISCLGLYGLVSFMAVQKTKEIGIRKVLGASVGHIVMLLSKEFLILITVAFVIAIPVAYYLMNNWLANFVYRVPLGVGAFVAAIGLSLLIAWITIGYRAGRAALANPVKSLRSE